MTQLVLYGRTETGPVREANEDLILVGREIRNDGDAGLVVTAGDETMQRDGLLAAVADGMGGHAAGATAARMALEALDAAFHGSVNGGGLFALVNAVRASGEQANRTVTEAGASRPECAGMGCTLAGVALLGLEYVVFHAGDSRVYRLRNGALRQLTEDDTLVAMAVRSGRMTPEEAETSPARHYVTNATGVPNFELHVAEPQSLRSGDTLLICSDGLHGLVDFETLESLVSQEGTPARRAAALAAEAVARGGLDNISAILVDVRQAEDPVPHG